LSTSKIHAYLRAPVANIQLERVGPFVARFTLGTGHPMLNYAVPDDGASPSARDIRALIALFGRRDLKPRLEYEADSAPALEELLVAAGFVVEARLQLMGCRPADAQPIEPSPQFTVVKADTDADHGDAIIVADEEYGEPKGRPRRGQVTARREMTAAGGAVVLARERATGAPVGSGLFPPPRAGVSELAAVGTREAFRGRGVATAVTSHLVGCARHNGVEFLWLTPENDQAESIYGQVGFACLGGYMVHISRPVGRERS
jgi:GNAT superfamily N-acetyltransferase